MIKGIIRGIKETMKIVIAGLLAIIMLGGAISAIAATRTVDANVEVTVWESVSNGNLYLSTRPEGGKWTTHNTALKMTPSASGRFLQGSAITVTVPVEVNVPTPAPTVAPTSTPAPTVAPTSTPAPDYEIVMSGSGDAKAYTYLTAGRWIVATDGTGAYSSSCWLWLNNVDDGTLEKVRDGGTPGAQAVYITVGSQYPADISPGLIEVEPIGCESWAMIADPR